jgi:mannose-6-phosphate isomerase-like protein (cupin superfamily)
MPIFHGSMAAAPAWCELTAFEVLRLPAGARHEFARVAPKERLIVASGSCHLLAGAEDAEAKAGAKHELAGAADHFVVAVAHEPTTVVRLCGSWGEETGGWGLFNVEEVADPIERGDPTDYPKQTRIDNHYHDCDEYWIFLEGAGTAVSEGRHYDVGPGDCVATGMGHHHDFPLVTAPVRAVYFETTLQGARRRGHLWNHTHGQAQPQPERC